jgi:endonuclease/exonuclease/phosphatase (EEP) superfamily protein YafD
MKIRNGVATAAALVAMVAFAACSSGGGTAADSRSHGTGADGSAARRGGELSVLSYNVAGLPAEISKEDPAKHLPLISPLLNDFDVVLTQEDFDWWGEVAGGLDFVHYHERLRADAVHKFRSPQHPGPEAVGMTPDRRPTLQIGDGLGVLSKLPIEGNERVPWEGCFGGFDTSDGGAADCLAMKGFSMTRLTLADGAVVDLYNLHLEAGGTATDQGLQADDVAQLGAYIVEHSAGNAVILGGDTNLHTDHEHPDGSDGADIELWDQLLSQTGLTDSCAAVSCPGTGRIDKIAFRSGKGVKLEALRHQFHGDTFVDEAGDALSDHEPLEVRFRWTRA